MVKRDMNHYHTGRLRKLSLLISDVLLINLSILIYNWLFLDFTLFDMGAGIPIVLVITCSITTFTFYMFDLYSEWKRKSIKKLVLTVSIAVVTSYLIAIASTMIYQPLLYTKGSILAFFAIQLLLLGLFRSIYWFVGRRTSGNKRVLVIGANKEADLETIYKLLNHTQGWLELESYLSAYEKPMLHYYLKKADVIVLCPSLTREEKKEIMCICSSRGLEVIMVPELEELLIQKSSLQQLDDMPVLSIKPFGITNTQSFIKRIFDILVASMLLIISSPVLLILFVLIPLTSKGSALFKQERLGEYEKPYLLYKFRSMVNDAEKQTGPVLASDKDPRITPIGSFIRSTRLDELPQLFNVLKGEMSLIGPRPEREFFINQFKSDTPNYAHRMAIKPGLTGLAQILSNYSTSVENKLRFDLLYIRNYSFFLDLKILFQTVAVVLQRDQAGGVKETEKGLKDQIQVIANEEKKNVKSLTQIQ
ncbi:sugar transferase [Alkalihalobacillus macyae]|uniref:sugar transferase n=1 Tax=Guptibacillus hwajinpoensis TaxID=208199 RepID=UPI00273CEE1D|nr:sugar transferase [Alkalihalobacillus macyae]MDP4552604.1 sugar transferase [Alkalihalobacillus macyae]